MLKSFPHTKLITYIRVEKRGLILHGFRDLKRHSPLGVRVTKIIIFILTKQLLFAVYTIFYQSWYVKLEQGFHVKLLHSDFPKSSLCKTCIVNL